ncbi:MAG: insulinase family protein [Alphaproteobacteria bacterium]
MIDAFGRISRSCAFAIAALAVVWNAAPALAQTAPPPKPAWAFLASDIAPDPAVRYGILPNGMHYALMKNQLPPDAVSIRFDFRFGSLDETESEKGLAHFIEHMAFNGSHHVPEGEMVKILERLGLAFGADTNAQTGQEHTTYQFDLPKATDAKIDEGLFLAREIASELTLDPGAIDREKGVVLSEERRGDNFARRRNQQQLDFLLPGDYAASRMPIGEVKVIEGATHDQLSSLYDRFYRPERATLVIVGDIDVDAVEAKLKAKFSDWAGRGAPGVDPDKSYTPKVREAAASVFTHKDGGDSIAVYSLRPYEDLPDTAAYRRESNLLGFATGAIGRRFSRLANGDKPPFRAAGLNYSDVLEAADYAGGSVAVTPENWKAGLTALEQEWRRALLYGFTQQEIDEQIAALRSNQANAAQRENTRTTGQLVNQLIGSIQDDTVFSTPSSGLKRFEGWAPEVTPETVREVFVRRMSIGTPLFFMGSTVARPGVEKEIVAAWKASAAVKVEPPTKASAMKFAYTNFGKPGRVVKEARLADIDARTLTFANNVRLNLKKTSFQKNVVQVSVRVGGGILELPEKPFGLNDLMGAFASGGLEKHSDDDLRAILGGRQVQARFTASSTAFGGSYSTNPADLELQLQVAAAFLTHPGYRPEAERRWRESIVLSWPRLDANAQTVLSNQGLRLLTSGDKRFGYSPDDGEVNRSFTELKSALDPILATGAIEIAIVGDIDETKAITAVAKTFGALPKREATSTFFKSTEPVVFRKDHAPIVLTHNGEANQAIASVYWSVDIDPEAEPARAETLGVLGAIMRIKVTDEIRENLGATYSPSAGASLSSTYPGWGYVVSTAEVKPEDVGRVIAAMRKIAGQMRAGEITQDEFNRAITPSLEQLPRNATSNGYWLSLISQAQTRPDTLEQAKLPVIEARLRGVTLAGVTEAAQRWLKDADAQEMRVVPGEAAKPPAG